LKILDPACGSGAFLIKAIDILLEIYKEIQLFKQDEGEYTAVKRGRKKKKDQGQLTLLKWNEEDEARKIIENSIYGVDLNEESVEITKLSLFLKIVKRNRKLIDLSKNIKCGNSLIDDSSLDEKAFNWKKEFPFKFDVVIGNPPYVRQEKFKGIKVQLRKYLTYSERADLYVYFFEKGRELLKEGGILGYISSNTFLKTKFGKELRQFLKEKTEIQKILNLGETQFFEGATTYPVILIFKKVDIPNLKWKLNSYEIRKLKGENFLHAIKTGWKQSRQKDLELDHWSFESNMAFALFKKIHKNSISLKDYCGAPLYGIKTGLNEAFMIDKSTMKNLIKTDPKNKEIIKPILKGKDLMRWYTPASENYIIYTFKGVPIEDYPYVKDYLSQFQEKLSKRATKQKWWELQQPQAKYVKFMEKSKICYIDIASEPTFSLDKKRNYLANSVYFLPTDDPYLLCLLNSDLCKWFMFFVSRGYRGGFVTFRNIYLERFPIKKISESQKMKFNYLAYKQIDLREKIEQNKSKFIRRITSFFALNKISNNLKKFWTLDFSMFLKEIRKSSNKKLSLKDQDEWEDYFNEYKNELLDLNEVIDKTDHEINQMVYKLFSLNKDEIAIIEQSLK